MRRSTHWFFYLFINNSRSKQNKENPEHPFLDIIKYKTCAKFQLKILNCRVVGVRQIFTFSDKKNWFLGNNTPLL